MGLKAEEFEGFLEFSKPFLEQVKIVFKTMAECEVTTSKPYIKNDNNSFEGVTAVMNISGTRQSNGQEAPFEGVLVLLFPLETYFKVASQMMMGEYVSMQREIEDLGAEIANMITGNVKQKLKNQSLFIGKALPKTIGPDEQAVVKYPNQGVVVAIPISSKFGDFILELSYSTDSQLSENESIQLDSIDEMSIDYDDLLKDSEKKIDKEAQIKKYFQECLDDLDESADSSDIDVDLGMSHESEDDDLGDDDFEDDDFEGDDLGDFEDDL